jgi:hypothetical protein
MMKSFTLIVYYAIIATGQNISFAKRRNNVVI